MEPNTYIAKTIIFFFDVQVKKSMKNYQDYYDEELRASVYKFYQQDFTLFGYSESLE